MADAYTAMVWAIAGLAFVLGVQILGPGPLLAVLALALALIAALGFAVGARLRRLHERHDPRFEPTDEVFFDPASRRKVRVHVDRATGERRYWRVP